MNAYVSHCPKVQIFFYVTEHKLLTFKVEYVYG